MTLYTADLTTATDVDGTIVPGNPITMTGFSTFHYFHIPAIVFSPAQHYTITITYTGGDIGLEFWLYSQPTPDLDGYNNGQWETLARDVILPSSGGTIQFVVGPTVNDWDDAVTAGEAYCIFEVNEPSPFDLEINSITWEESGTPAPPEVISVLTGTYEPNLIAWDGERSYFCSWGGNNLPKFRVYINEDWKSVIKGSHVTGYNDYTFNSNEVVQGIVPIRKTDGFSNNWYIKCYNLDKDELAVSGQSIYPINPMMSGLPQIDAMIVPYLSGEIYLISRATGNILTLWKGTVTPEGDMSAFTSQGTMTYPNPGAWPGAGGSYHATSLDNDPAQISENIFYMGQNRGMWDLNNPLVIKEAYGITGSTNGMNPAFDTQDAGMGLTTACYLNPGHLLMAQRNQTAINSSLRSQMVDNLLDGDGDVVSQRFWSLPDGFNAAGRTWAKMPDGTIDAVVACRDASTWRFFYNIFDNPTEWIYPTVSLGVLSNVIFMAPSQRAGFVFGASINNPFLGNRFVSVQFGGDMGRLKVWVPQTSEWKFATPKVGENAGTGRLRVWDGSAWIPSDGMDEE